MPRGVLRSVTAGLFAHDYNGFPFWSCLPFQRPVSLHWCWMLPLLGTALFLRFILLRGVQSKRPKATLESQRRSILSWFPLSLHRFRGRCSSCIYSSRQEAHGGCGSCKPLCDKPPKDCIEVSSGFCLASTCLGPWSFLRSCTCWALSTSGSNKGSWPLPQLR